MVIGIAPDRCCVTVMKSRKVTFFALFALRRASVVILCSTRINTASCDTFTSLTPAVLNQAYVSELSMCASNYETAGCMHVDLAPL